MLNIIRFLICIILISNACGAYADDLIVTIKNDHCQATLSGDVYKCSIGGHGITKDKAEGDGKTPIGAFALRHVLVRSDRVPKHLLQYISLPMEEIQPFDGWCDDPSSPYYNKYVNLSSFDKSVSHEELWREDDLYNIIVVVGYNDAPVKPGKGSAIFIHVARPKYAGTAGCIGFEQSDLLKILRELDHNSMLIVHA